MICLPSSVINAGILVRRDVRRGDGEAWKSAEKKAGRKAGGREGRREVRGEPWVWGWKLPRCRVFRGLPFKVQRGLGGVALCMEMGTVRGAPALPGLSKCYKPLNRISKQIEKHATSVKESARV